MVDPIQIQRVLVNLFTNAVQAMPNGSVLRVDGKRVDHEVELRVVDTGSGIRAEDMARIFDPLVTTKTK